MEQTAFSLSAPKRDYRKRRLSDMIEQHEVDYYERRTQ